MSGLLDFAQGASNAVAGNVTGPVDLITLLLRAAGVKIDKPVGGSEWAREKGLIVDPKNRAMGLLGEAAGMTAPIVAAAKAPEIAANLLKHGEQFQRYNQSAGPAGASLATVWHGSPHKFDKFDSSKIGTGEGAQAYGHGLYLADAEPTGREYAWQLSQRLPDRIKLAGKPVPSNDMLGRALEDVALLGKPAALQKIDDAIAFNEKYAPDMASLYRSLKEKIAQVDPAAVDVNRGNLYKVDLPDSAIAKMLDWDAPLSKQAPEVRKALAPFVEKQKALTADPKWGDLGDPSKYEGMTTGQQIYRTLHEDAIRGGKALPAAEKERQMVEGLRKLGIPGIKYYDGMSRGAGQGTRNYVVFPKEEGLLTILERNGEKLK